MGVLVLVFDIVGVLVFVGVQVGLLDGVLLGVKLILGLILGVFVFVTDGDNDVVIVGVTEMLGVGGGTALSTVNGINNSPTG